MRNRWWSFHPILGVLGLALLAGAKPTWSAPSRNDPGDPRSSYSYFRTLDGEAWILPSGRGPSGAEKAEVHLPVQTGDRVELGPGARAELVLADRSRLYLGSGTQIVVGQVAFSADGSARTTRLELISGELVLRVPETALGDELPTLLTPVGQVFVQDPGTYRVRWEERSGLEVTVREGWAELLTSRGSIVIRKGETARLAPHLGDLPTVQPANRTSSLEHWQEELERGALARASRMGYIEPELAYAAAPLDGFGTWVFIDTTWYWRPHVDPSWRPYWNGRWYWTPSGYVWVSYDPWGWVPDHYGTWIYYPRWGWCWRPGRVFAPAWVYWSWGPSWTGWCPIGVYLYNHPWTGWIGFRFGLYGWTRTSWTFFVDWTFVPTRWACSRDWSRHRVHGRDLARRQGGGVLEGVITTDTRPIPPERLRRPEEIPAVFRREAERAGQPWLDVSDFVARKPELNERLRRALELPRERARELAGTPLVIDPQIEREIERNQSADRSGWAVHRNPGLELEKHQNGEGKALSPFQPQGDRPGNVPPEERQGWRMRNGSRPEPTEDSPFRGGTRSELERPREAPDTPRWRDPADPRVRDPRSIPLLGENDDGGGKRLRPGISLEPSGRIPDPSGPQGWRVQRGGSPIEDGRPARAAKGDNPQRATSEDLATSSQRGWFDDPSSTSGNRSPMERVLEGIRRQAADAPASPSQERGPGVSSTERARSFGSERGSGRGGERGQGMSVSQLQGGARGGPKETAMGHGDHPSGATGRSRGSVSRETNRTPSTPRQPEEPPAETPF